jgi:hypothetical protein
MLSNGYVRTARTVLESLGYNVEEKARVKGFSGFEHDFDLLARKGEKVICMSIRQANPTKMFAEIVKGIDIKHEIVVAVEGEPPPKALEFAREGRIKIIAFKSPEELVEKLRQIIA